MNEVKFFLILLTLGVRLGYGQSIVKDNEVLATHANQDANTMGHAFINGDYQTFARYTYPTLLKAMGGENIMVATLKQIENDMRSKGLSFMDIVIDSPSKVLKSNNELQCTLQQHTTIKLATGRALTTSTLIAISNDGGKKWTFVDTNNKTTAMMRKVLPNLNSAIVIPPQQKAIIYNF